MTKVQRERDRANRKNLARKLAIVADPAIPMGRRKRAARLAAAMAERVGLIERPRACQRCGKKRRLERHHADHLDPLRIEWLCSAGCHRLADMASSTRVAATSA